MPVPGQNQQVVYLHNPMHKAKAPPATVDAWDTASAAGPLAAFAQLHPGVQVLILPAQACKNMQWTEKRIKLFFAV